MLVQAQETRKTEKPQGRMLFLTCTNCLVTLNAGRKLEKGGMLVQALEDAVWVRAG